MTIPPTITVHSTAARRRCTGEPHQALHALRADGQEWCSIPAAHGTEQTDLESAIALRVSGIGGLSKHPMGIVSLRPDPGRLTLRLLHEPYVIAFWAQLLLPIVDDSSAFSDARDAVTGVPGLRFYLSSHAVHLTRPGTPVDVRLTGFNPRWWQRIADKLYHERTGAQAVFAHRRWSAIEREAVAAYRRAGTLHDARVGSALLRRIRATAGTGRANGTDIWTTRLGGMQWTLETTDGPACADIFPLLTQPPTGPGWRLTEEHCRCPHADGPCTAYLDPGDGQRVYYSNLRWGRTEPTDRAVAWISELNQDAFR
jgi:hypothetical protein